MIRINTLFAARVTPFAIGVYTDDDELTGDGTAAEAMPACGAVNEASNGAVANQRALGTQGFSLGFSQIAC